MNSVENLNQWQAVDPEFKSRVAESFQKQAFMQTLGVELTRVEPGYCEMELAYAEKLTQQHGYFHAGVIATLADNSAGYASFSLMRPGSEVLSTEFKVNLLAPGRGELLRAKSRVVKNGRSLKICQSEVYSHQHGEQTLCAIAIVSLMEMRIR